MDSRNWSFNMANHRYSNEIQIEIDDVYGCPGHCPGCTLSSLERKSDHADMAPEVMVNAINKLKQYVPTLKNLEKINLTYGIADHFLMSKEYLAHTYDLGASLIEEANLSNPYNGIFYSASMIGKHELIMEKVRFMHDLSKKRGIPFYIIAVLDPKHLYHKKFAEVYKKNIIETAKLIGKVDLTINLSEEAINFITPQDLFEFALQNHFDEVTINWTPTFDNLQFVYMNQQKLASWLLEFDRLISDSKKLDTSYRPVIIKTINNLKCKQPEQELSFQENLEYNLPELVHKSIQIDDKGNIFPKYEAIGDIAHTPRLGFEPIGNVMQEQGISEMFERHINITKKNVTKQFLQEPCDSCEFNQYCANSGFHIYNHVLQKAAKKDINISMALKNNIEQHGCPHVAKQMFKHYEGICENIDNQSDKSEF
jgi:radical SAM protein with 4Fe4S-binding SPASM domain